MPFSPDPPPASVSERLCLCYSVHVCGFSLSCVGFAAALCFFLGRFEELFIAACWSSEHVLRLLPPAHLISSHLISPPGFMMLLDSPSSSHTSNSRSSVVPVLILCFLSSFPLCFRHDHLPSASLGVSACELLMVAGWQ